MRLLTVVALMLASSAFAGEYASRTLSFSPFSNSGGTISYYTCDSAEDTVEQRLEDLGATNIRVRCSGGLENWGNRWEAMPVFVRATFDVPVNGTTTRTVTLKSRGGDTSCDFNVQLMRDVLPMFPGIKVLSKKSSCFGGRTDRWSYTLEVTE